MASATHTSAAAAVDSAVGDGPPAAVLRDLADRIDSGEVTLSAADTAATLRRAADELDHDRHRAEAALASALRWKERALASWADNSRGAAADRAELVDLREHAHELSTELTAIRHTLSWRVTAPLRAVRRLRPGRGQ